MRTIPMYSIIVLLTIQRSFAQSLFTTASLFTDNMVLQQKSIVPVWGTGLPGATVVITTSWKATASCIVQTDSTWRGKIKTPRYGGPHIVSLVHQYDTVTFTNVMIGEVWLCSGQSNMEMPLQGWPPNDTIDHSTEDIRLAAYPCIRLFTVQRTMARTPQGTTSGSWRECTPEAAATFSATAFHFGKRLHQELNVPIGLILAAWGGTPVQSWTNEAFITQHPDYADLPAQLQKSESELKRYLSWLSSHTTIDMSTQTNADKYKGLSFGDEQYAQPEFNDSTWRSMTLPGGWEQSEVGVFDGALWFRKLLQIPPQWKNKELTLELGPIDDYDITFVNGIRVGGLESAGSWNVNRIYTVPGDLVKDSIMTIAVRVIDNLAGGGLWGQPEQLSIRAAGESLRVSLAGEWKYLPVAEFRDEKFYVLNNDPGEFYTRPVISLEYSSQTPTVLYNGMIAPLVPFAIKGVIWYQGESNVIDPERYTSLFPLMIRNWRSDWNTDFSFYYVQIAPFNYGSGSASHRIREAQLQTLNVPKTGMAVTLDIGNAANIHPSNKTDVGNRLARWALAKDYKKKIAYSGPVVKSVTRKNNTMILSFDHGEGLTLKKRNKKTFLTIAGEDSVFINAEAKVKGNTLHVWSPAVKKPFAVRYGWENAPDATIFNAAGLPASSFRTDQWNR